ncbi:hypothetical protein VTI74DRAFT_11048 [Chaetomium olivicolor]
MHLLDLPLPLTFLLLLPLGLGGALAQQQETPALTIFTPRSGYTYQGCYNETTGLPNTTGARALGGGTNLVRPGNMTVEMCLDFCKTGAGDASGGKTGSFKYAGLEYARECWCAQTLSSMSDKFPDSACNLPCEGNTTQACGGNLKITVYMAGAAAARVTWTAGLVAVGAISLVMI